MTFSAFLRVSLSYGLSFDLPELRRPTTRAQLHNGFSRKPMDMTGASETNVEVILIFMSLVTEPAVIV